MRLDAQKLRRRSLVGIIDLGVEGPSMSLVKVAHSCFRSLLAVINHDFAIVSRPLVELSGVLHKGRTVDSHLNSSLGGKFLHRVPIFS